MEFTRERFRIIIVGTLAIIALGLYLFLYGPLISKLRKAHLECSRIETEILHARESIANLDKMDIKKSLVPEDNSSVSIDEFTRQGKSKGINFISITAKRIEESGDSRYKILPVDMEIESSYEDLGVFLGLVDELEKSLVTVKNFNIVPDKEKTSRINARLVVDMYLSAR
jgi:Tfp pilus assembly protein PilO